MFTNAKHTYLKLCSFYSFYITFLFVFVQRLDGIEITNKDRIQAKQKHEIAMELLQKAKLEKDREEAEKEKLKKEGKYEIELSE